MAHVSSFSRFFTLFFLLAGACFAGWAQRPPQSVVYDSLGQPLRMRHEIIVGFAPAAINRAAVSSRAGNEGPLSQFIKPAVGTALESSIGLSLSSIYAVKRTSMIPADSIGLDNTGQPILLYPFWSTLLLILPEEADDYAVQNALRQYGFAVVQYAHFNWANVAASSTIGSVPPFLLAPGEGRPLAYPLPAHDVLTFALPYPLPASAEITVFNTAGQTVHTEKHQVYRNGELLPLQIEVAALPVGQYFYRLTTPTNTYRGRFEKQN
jgi:hypothetical protein